MENTVLYAIFTIPFFLIFWVIGSKTFAHLRIQPNRTATAQHIWYAIGYAIPTLAIFAVIDAYMMHLQGQGYTFLYDNIADYGWTWLIISAFLVIILDDAFFYFSHRLMHHPKLYKYFHTVHHHSTDAHPFVGLAFAPTEAVVQNMTYSILPFVFPIHWSVVLFWQLFGITNNLIAHTGYELYPKFWTKTPILRLKTTSTHHNMHHEFFNGNYSLHFTWWDKLLGTEFPDTEQRHIALHERRNNTQNTPTIAPSTQNKTTVEASIGNKTYTFDIDKNTPILHSALAQNIPLPHSCKNGICGKCKLHCSEGQVNSSSSLILSASEQHKGYILTCQSTPVSDYIKLHQK
jgi:sterol desaturase/sphingolipid hydroxylase (fatty acid hydroxylase superfamily)